MIVRLLDNLLLVLSAKLPSETTASQQLAAVLILYTYKISYKLAYILYHRAEA